MPIYPGATYRPISLHDAKGNWWHTNGPMRSYRGAVLHVNQSNGNLFNYISTSSAGTSCHFEAYKSGALEQYIDTHYQSWCQTNGNYDWISIETEGFVTEALTAAQLATIAKLYEWLHATHGIPLVTTQDPVNGHGFIYHGAGGASWGGHPACAGALRNPQRQTILDLISKPAPQPPAPKIVEDDMARVFVSVSGGPPGVNLGIWELTPDGDAHWIRDSASMADLQKVVDGQNQHVWISGGTVTWSEICGRLLDKRGAGSVVELPAGAVLAAPTGALVTLPTRVVNPV